MDVVKRCEFFDRIPDITVVLVGIIGSSLGILSKVLDLLGYYRKSAAGLTRAGSFYGCVQRKEICLVCNSDYIVGQIVDPFNCLGSFDLFRYGFTGSVFILCQ